jgi:hypothetical protein
MKALRFAAAIIFALVLMFSFLAESVKADDWYLESTRSYTQGYDGYYPQYAVHFAYGHGFVRIYYRSIYGYDFSVDSWQDCWWDVNGCNKYVNGPAYHDWAHVVGASVFWSMHSGNHSTYFISTWFYYSGVPQITAGAQWCDTCVD